MNKIFPYVHRFKNLRKIAIFNLKIYSRHRVFSNINSRWKSNTHEQHAQREKKLPLGESLHNPFNEYDIKRA